MNIKIFLIRKKQGFNSFYHYVKNNPIKMISSIYVGTCVGIYIATIGTLYYLERYDMKFPQLTFMEKQKLSLMAGYNLPFLCILFLYNIPLSLMNFYKNTEYINKLINYGK